MSTIKEHLILNKMYVFTVILLSIFSITSGHLFTADSLGCKWSLGVGEGGTRAEIIGAKSKGACLTMVREKHPDANGATFSTFIKERNNWKCFAQFNMTHTFGDGKDDRYSEAIYMACKFQISGQSALCETYDNGRCFRTKTGDNDQYAPGASCTITANADVTLNVTSFDVEGRGSSREDVCLFDALSIFGNNYCGSELTGNPEWVSPHGVQVTKGNVMLWTSDNVINKAGFEICGECATGFFYDGICRSCHSIDVINGTCKECADATTCTMVDYDCEKTENFKIGGGNVLIETAKCGCENIYEGFEASARPFLTSGYVASLAVCEETCLVNDNCVGLDFIVTNPEVELGNVCHTYKDSCPSPSYRCNIGWTHYEIDRAPNAHCTACYDATTCSAFECAEGYENADGNATNGCECSASTIVIPNAVCTACSSDGTCSAVECDSGYIDSDGNATNGCESNCPSLPNGVCQACSNATTCSAFECDSGYIDSDGDPLNGCEGLTAFQIVSGHDYCETYDNGRCFRTIPAADGKYASNADCHIRAMFNVTLNVIGFHVEVHSLCKWDYLRLYGTQSNNVSILLGAQWENGQIMDTVYDDTLVTSKNVWPNNYVDICGGGERLATYSGKKYNVPGSSSFALALDGLKLDGISLGFDLLFHSDDVVGEGGIDICAGDYDYCTAVPFHNGVCTKCSDEKTCLRFECDAGKFNSDGDITNGCESDYDCQTIDVSRGRCKKCSDATTCTALFDCRYKEFDSDGDAQNGCESDYNCNAIVSSTTACAAEEGCDINMVDSVCTLCAPKWRYLNHNRTLVDAYLNLGKPNELLVCEDFCKK